MGICPGLPAPAPADPSGDVHAPQGGLAVGRRETGVWCQPIPLPPSEEEHVSKGSDAHGGCWAWRRQGCCHPLLLHHLPSPAGMGMGSRLDAHTSSRGDAATVGLRFFLLCPLWRLLQIVGGPGSQQGFCCSPLHDCDSFLRAQGPPRSPNFL